MKDDVMYNLQKLIKTIMTTQFIKLQNKYKEIARETKNKI